MIIIAITYSQKSYVYNIVKIKKIIKNENSDFLPSVTKIIDSVL